jgi:hypothetical protein
MLSVVMLSVVMLSVVMLSVVMLNVIMLNAVMLSVVAPRGEPVENEEGDAKAEPDADEGQLLDGAGQQVVNHFQS